MTIAEFDHLSTDKKRELLFQCCGSKKWVDKMLGMPPAEDLIDLFEDAEEKWYECTEADWKEAFSKHPHIGADNASEQTLQALSEANKRYREKFGYTFIAHSDGKSSIELLGMLTARMQNDPEKEIKIAMDEQNKITRSKLEKIFEA